MLTVADRSKSNFTAKRLCCEIEQVIDTFVHEHNHPAYWRNPRVAIASSQDPLMLRLKEVVDPLHALPCNLLPEARSVIVYFIPFQMQVGIENSQSGFYAARTWAEAYTATNMLIDAVNIHLSACLGTCGHKAATTPATHNFDADKLVSLWSHKHLGYIAGLGTFGMHHLLITESGCCGRIGSLVTTMALPPTPRTEQESCLVKAGRNCKACIARCRYGALNHHSFDRHACYAQCLRNDAYYKDLGLVDVCGKCACEVPCSYTIPGNAVNITKECGK